MISLAVLQYPKNGGIIRGDIVTEYDGKSISNYREFKYLVADTRVGKKVSIKVIRDGREKVLMVVIGQLKPFTLN